MCFLVIILLAVSSTVLFEHPYHIFEHSHIFKIHRPILTCLRKSSKRYLLLFFFFLLKDFALLILFLNSSSDIVDPNGPGISDLLVYHYDCSKQRHLCQFFSTRVQPCAPAPSASGSTRVIANVFVRAKVEHRLETWTCEVFVKRKPFSVINPIANTADMVVLIIIKIPWSFLVL